MPSQQTVLLLGATGRTGRRVLGQLLDRGVDVRVIARSIDRLPSDYANKPNLTITEADLLRLSDQNLQAQVRGCTAVISCLGHVTNLKGIFGPPHDLVAQATTRVCRAIEAIAPSEQVKFVLMSSVSVNRRGTPDPRRGAIQRALLWVLRGLIPPANDNQKAADFLNRAIGVTNSYVQWVVIRPDTLVDGDVSEYRVHESLVSSLFAPEKTAMANVAHFMCELVVNPKTWSDWSGKLPVVTNVGRTA